MPRFALLFLCVCALQVQQAFTWGYHGNEGPANWGTTYPNCLKTRQSPIVLTDDNSVYTNSYQKFEFHNYSTATSNSSFRLQNNGHTVQITVLDSTWQRVKAFGQTFKPWQIHFHWGKTDNEGSEHRSRSTHLHPAEMHFVHVNTKYANTSEALKHFDGLLVFGTIIEISANGAANNTLLQKAVKYFDQITYDGQSVNIPAFTLSETFTVNSTRYFHYNGSLTTPGCYQAVLWIVFREPIFMSRAQITEYRKLRHDPIAKKNASHPEYISNNYRPLQARNSRNIFRTFEADSSASAFVPSLGLITVFAYLVARL